MRPVIAWFAALAVVLVGGPLAMASSAAADPAANPWLDMRVMNMAHSGGESEAPMNTLYAFKRAHALGADMLELDVQSTSDGHLVVIHDATVDDTTQGSGRVVDMTLADVQRLDAAYWFVPGLSTDHDQPGDAYPLRGARDGAVAVEGYTGDDFAIPTLRQVFEAFPDTPINIEIKGTRDSDLDSYLRTGRLLADLVNESGRTDLIVGSFKDAALADFHTRAPQIGLSTGRDATTRYVLMRTPPPPGTVALQLPVNQGGIRIITRDLVTRAHQDGYAVHAWFSGTAPDDAETYNAMLDACVDGLMPSRPSLLEAILDARAVERPGSDDGSPVPGCSSDDPPVVDPPDPSPTDPSPTDTSPTDPAPTDPSPTTASPTTTPPSTSPTVVTSPGGEVTTERPSGAPKRPAVVQTDSAWRDRPWRGAAAGLALLTLLTGAMGVLRYSRRAPGSHRV